MRKLRIKAQGFPKLSVAEKRRRERAYDEIWSEIETEIEKFHDLIAKEALAELRELEKLFPMLRRLAPEISASSTDQSLARLNAAATGQAYQDALNMNLSTIQLKRGDTFETRVSGTLGKASEKFSATATTRLGYKSVGYPRAMNSWLNNRVPEIVEKISNDRKKSIFQTVARGARRGETINEIENRVRSKYDTFARSTSAGIARTEIGFIHARSEWISIKALGIDPKTLDKIWLSSRDMRVRGLRKGDKAHHNTMDGQRRRFDQRFSNGLMYPREAGQSAREVINCRCVLLFERVGKMRRVDPGKFNTRTTVPFNQFGDKWIDNGLPSSIILPEELIEALDPLIRDDVLDAARVLFDKGKLAEPELSSLFQEIAKLENGEIHHFATRLKSRKSIISKLGRIMDEKGMNLSQAIDDIRDINRYTMVFKHESFTKNATSAIKKFDEKGWKLFKANNSFDDDMYHGYNTWFVKDGQYIEVQFHTPTSIKIKDPSHKLFSKSRELAKGSAERKALEDQIRDLWKKDVLPDNWQALPKPGQVIDDVVKKVDDVVTKIDDVVVKNDVLLPKTADQWTDDAVANYQKEVRKLRETNLARQKVFDLDTGEPLKNYTDVGKGNKKYLKISKSPDGTPFNSQDWKAFTQYDNFKEMRVITSEGEYIVTKPPSGFAFSANDIERMYLDLVDEVFFEWKDIETTTKMIMDEVNKRLAAKVGTQFTFEVKPAAFRVYDLLDNIDDLKMVKMPTGVLDAKQAKLMEGYADDISKKLLEVDDLKPVIGQFDDPADYQAALAEWTQYKQELKSTFRAIKDGQSVGEGASIVVNAENKAVGALSYTEAQAGESLYVTNIGGTQNGLMKHLVREAVEESFEQSAKGAVRMYPHMMGYDDIDDLLRSLGFTETGGQWSLTSVNAEKLRKTIQKIGRLNMSTLYEDVLSALDDGVHYIGKRALHSADDKEMLEAINTTLTRKIDDGYEQLRLLDEGSDAYKAVEADLNAWLKMKQAVGDVSGINSDSLAFMMSNGNVTGAVQYGDVLGHVNRMRINRLIKVSDAGEDVFEALLHRVIDTSIATNQQGTLLVNFAFDNTIKDAKSVVGKFYKKVGFKRITSGPYKDNMYLKSYKGLKYNGVEVDTFVPAKTLDEAHDFARLHFGTEKFETSINLDAWNVVNEELFKQKKSWDFTLRTIGDADPTAYASANQVSMNFNPMFFNNPEFMLEKLKNNVYTGFHPIGGDTMQAVVQHELGHVLSLDELYYGSSRFKKIIKDMYSEYRLEFNRIMVKSSQRTGSMSIKTNMTHTYSLQNADELTDELREMLVSTYALKEPAEFIAEAFSMALSAENPTPYAQKVYDLMIKYLQNTPRH